MIIVGCELSVKMNKMTESDLINLFVIEDTQMVIIWK